MKSKTNAYIVDLNVRIYIYRENEMRLIFDEGAYMLDVTDSFKANSSFFQEIRDIPNGRSQNSAIDGIRSEIS